MPATLALLARQESLSKSFLERMELSLKSEPASQQETAWGVINGLTQASKGLSADDRYAVETLAGRLIEEGLPQPPAAPVATSRRDRQLLESPLAALEPSAGNEDKTSRAETDGVEANGVETSEREDSEREDNDDSMDGRGEHEKWLGGKQIAANHPIGNQLTEHWSNGSRSIAN